MRSTGEVMGFDDSYGMAFAKAQVSAGNVLPESGRQLIVTVNDARSRDGHTDAATASAISASTLMATRGMHQYSDPPRRACARRVYKVNEGRPNIVDHIVTGDVALLINTPLGKQSQYDDYAMRRAAITYERALPDNDVCDDCSGGRADRSPHDASRGPISSGTHRVDPAWRSAPH